MPTVKTQINCPNCKQPIVAEIEQLFDIGVDPQAKQRFLQGAFNVATCPHCGYNGMLSTPLVYHDPEKELLLTFSPPELVLPRDEQERAFGVLINQAVNNLPPEKRKGYLFSPQSVLTLEGMIERVLGADGVTPEMIQAQKDRMNLIQRLVGLEEDEFAEVAEQEDALIDEDFFMALSRLAELSLAAGDQASAQKLAEVQRALLPITTFGKKLEEEAKEVDAVVKTLQEAGEELTREKVMEVVLEYADNNTQLSTLVSLARPALDYQFFQMLSEHIEKAEGDEKEKLSGLREQLLELTQAVDKQLEARVALAYKNLDILLGAEDIVGATLQNLPAIDDFFLQVLSQELAVAQKEENKERLEKLQLVMEAIQQASSASPELALIQELLDAPDESERDKILKDRSEELTDKFLETLTGVMMQLQESEDQEITEKVRGLYRAAVRQTMQASMKK